jgi:hypothetical protein
MDEASGTDLFISYHWADAEAVRAFAVALQAHGISASFDPLRDDQEEIRRRVTFAITHSKAFVAWHSPHYRQQRALQLEFMSAFAAAARHGEERQRIIVMNFATQVQPFLPPSTGARCRVEPADSATETLNAIAARLAAHVATLHGHLGGNSNPSPQWLPYEVCGFERFIGRVAELWHIHEFFAAPRSGERAPRALQLNGPAAIGKSALAHEYAVRFATKYPGGIFCLDAGCLRINSAGELQTAREHAWYELVARLGLPVADRGFAEVADSLRGYLAERALPFLWIVDHAPGGLGIDAIRSWLAPHPLGDTLMICRSSEYAQLGPQMQLNALQADEAQVLLTCRQKADQEAQVAQAPYLIEQLSPQPLAVDLAGAQLRSSSCERLSGHLSSPAKDALQLADDLVMQCSDAHRNGIAVMLLRGIGYLGSQARSCLRISAVLANAPIPMALAITALAQQARSSEPVSLSEAELAIDELVDAALAMRVNDEYFSLSPLVRYAVLSHETAHDLDSARALVATTLASELIQAPEPSYSNPYVRWIPHALHIAETAAPSNQLVEITAWLSRFETVGALRTGNRRALSRLQEGDIAKAQELLDMELAATRRGLGEDHPGTITFVNNLGAVLGLRGDLPGARTLFEHALEVRGKALGEQHPDTLTPLNNLAVILWSESDLEGAQALFECVVEQRQRWLGEAHPETLIAMKNLAVTLRQRGDFATARSLLERVVTARQAALGPHHRDTRAAVASLARTLSEESEALLARAAKEGPPAASLMERPDRSHVSVHMAG